jgi:excisionase family DNA binding protein
MTKTNAALIAVLDAQTDLLFALEKIIEANTALVESLQAPAQYLTAQEYADRYRISVTTVYRKVRNGELDGRFIGKRCTVRDPEAS